MINLTYHCGSLSSRRQAKNYEIGCLFTELQAMTSSSAVVLVTNDQLPCFVEVFRFENPILSAAQWKRQRNCVPNLSTFDGAKE